MLYMTDSTWAESSVSNTAYPACCAEGCWKQEKENNYPMVSIPPFLAPQKWGRLLEDY